MVSALLGPNVPILEVRHTPGIWCNQAVMSGLLDPEISAIIGVFRHTRRRLFTSVHGVSVVNLWSVLDRCERAWDQPTASAMPAVRGLSCLNHSFNLRPS